MIKYGKKLLASAALLPYSAFAAVPDFGQLADNVRSQYDNIVYLLTATTYLLGIFYILHAIVMLKSLKASLMDENIVAAQKRAYWKEFFIGLALLFFPTLLAVLETSIFGSYNAITAGVGGIIYA